MGSRLKVRKLLVAGALLVAAAVNFARNGWATTQVRPYHGQSRSGGIVPVLAEAQVRQAVSSTQP